MNETDKRNVARLEYSGVSRRTGLWLGVVGSAITAAKYVAKHGLATTLRNGRNGAANLISRARDWASRKRSGGLACGCFTGATVVWAATGLIPIDQLQIGDEVYTRDPQTDALVLHTVTDTIVTEQAALLHVRILHGDGHEETLSTTDEHPFWVEGRGWVRADGLRIGDELASENPRATGRAPRVKSLTFTGERTTVYNLTVDGVPDYLVGSDGVLVHNCDPRRAIRNRHLAGGHHPVTGVPFDADGFPVFDSHAKKTVHLPDGQSGVRATDEAFANQMAGYSTTPSGFTWHHHQDGATMQLVDGAIHQRTGHTGGVGLLPPQAP